LAEQESREQAERLSLAVLLGACPVSESAIFSDEKNREKSPVKE
jgi:hypothetical protein